VPPERGGARLFDYPLLDAVLEPGAALGGMFDTIEPDAQPGRFARCCSTSMRR